MRSDSPPNRPPRERVLELPGLLEELAGRRAAGERVVFTNGCFDLLHAGHVALLEAAAALAEILVVGLNTDASVGRLKGPSRPLTPQGERARVLTALRAVDYVVLFDEETPLRVIRALKPDVLVKGDDYELDAIVGREVVESCGGRVVRVPLLPGCSTTALFAKLRGEPGDSE
jgi:D-beta-D-heptose 7-phosphate kinase/D-beta-D-heptose 1-phosphate adenosyltransferase